MNRLLIGFAAVTSIAGCSVSVPVSGYIGDDRALGQATATTSGPGTFEAYTVDGLKCFGTYDDNSTAPTLSTKIECNDGRTGVLLITRTQQLTSGTAVGKLSDGTLGQFVFGDITFSQAFDNGTDRIR